MAEDYYKILGVRRDASQAEIQRAYRELARKYHPDLHPDDKDATKKFQQVQAAFDVLNDPEKREMYDRYGSSFETMGAGGPRRGAAWGAAPEGGFGGFSFDDAGFAQFFGDRFEQDPTAGLADLFDQFRRATAGKGRKSTYAPPRRGSDISQELPIPFATSITGGQVQITVRRQSGKVETIAVRIPPGVEDGKKIRLRGQGEAAPSGGPPGDILITVRVTPHPWFQRHGNHLHVRVPITLGEAALGAKVDVPTPSGTVSLRVPPGTPSGTKFRIKGHGVAARDGSPGDLLAEVQIVLPKDLDEADRQSIRQIQERHPQDPRTTLRW